MFNIDLFGLFTHFKLLIIPQSFDIDMKLKKKKKNCLFLNIFKYNHSI